MSTQKSLILSETCLDDVADDDLHVAECVNPDGSTSFWILDPEEGPQGLARIPAHEQLGPLPMPIARRVASLPEAGRCNAPTKAGTRCRKSASGCPWHRATAGVA